MRKVEEKYVWTSHAQEKMRHYRLSESRVKRIIRHPDRTETGVADDTVAVMQRAGSSKPYEIWVMYAVQKGKDKKLRVLSAWRYPGESSARDPIPEDVLREAREVLWG